MVSGLYRESTWFRDVVGYMCHRGSQKGGTKLENP